MPTARHCGFITRPKCTSACEALSSGSCAGPPRRTPWAGDREAQALGVRLMTVGSPNWRSSALSLLKPVDVKSPGVEAWLLSRENAAALYEQLKSRADFREHSSPHVEIANGQVQTLARTQARQYVRGI